MTASVLKQVPNTQNERPLTLPSTDMKTTQLKQKRSYFVSYLILRRF